MGIRETNGQRELRERMLAESCIDPAVKLAVPPSWNPEKGPTARKYYAEKFRRGVPATYWLHQTTSWSEQI